MPDSSTAAAARSASGPGAQVDLGNFKEFPEDEFTLMLWLRIEARNQRLLHEHNTHTHTPWPLSEQDERGKPPLSNQNLKIPRACFCHPRRSTRRRRWPSSA